MATKKEPQQFEKISLRLTAAQLKKLAPFREKVNRGKASYETDTRCAVLGQVWLALGDKPDVGSADFYLIPAKQCRTINSAIMRARRSLNGK